MKKIAIVGCASYVKDVDLTRLSGIETIGANRILLHPSFKPDHVMCADRRVYAVEKARYSLVSETSDIMLADSLFDPSVRCHGTPAQEASPWKHTSWRCGNSQGPMEWGSLTRPLNSFTNIAGPMLQAAVIMGAQWIGMIGCGLVLSGKGTHFYEEKDNWPGNISRSQTWGCFIRAKYELDDMGVKVFNISPRTGPFERMYGRASLQEFLEEGE